MTCSPAPVTQRGASYVYRRWNQLDERPPILTPRDSSRWFDPAAGATEQEIPSET